MTYDDNEWLRWPERCCATIERGLRHAKEPVACEKPAVAVAIYTGDEYEPHTYPVCKHHARGRPMMSLVEIIASVQAARPPSAP